MNVYFFQESSTSSVKKFPQDAVFLKLESIEALREYIESFSYFYNKGVEKMIQYLSKEENECHTYIDGSGIGYIVTDKELGMPRQAVWLIQRFGLPKGQSVLLDVQPYQDYGGLGLHESFGDACERVAKSIKANWWTNSVQYGDNTYFANR